jgi:SprT protein
MKKDLREGLKPYLPERSLGQVMEWISGTHITVRIARGRTTKTGDYRPPARDGLHRISVNGDLNPYEFLITLTHEIAHMHVWDRYGKRARPHGAAWKTAYARLLGALIGKDIFPEEIESVIRKQLDNPKAGNKSDTELTKALHFHNASQAGIFLEDLPQDSLFLLQDGRKFLKQEKLRKWYRCINQHNYKSYRISPVARVFPVKD